MSTSFATVTTSKMELTPMRVKFDGVDLGGTLGNCVLNISYNKAEIKADQSGETVRDRRVSGFTCSLETELTEIQNKDLWKVVFPHATLVTSGPNKQIYFSQQVGDSDLVRAKELVLHPLSLADANLSGDYKFFKATASAESSITYGPTEQARLKIVWNILPDDSVTPERFLVHGDPAIGLIAASAAAAVAGGGNVGNGTVTGVAAFSGFTKTETITLLCVGVPAANQANFSVTGSLSGALGVASVGIGFSSSVIAFLINDGATDFVIGDSFTIATTAANYV